ncbi:MAG: biotin--[acetyl-CoA-carboxylase] ligase [Planctomycetes bacterium]|nr:biotin--[acetyl-CoA-carboxylase] ligase [Planctomycetota bacterium]
MSRALIQFLKKQSDFVPVDVVADELDLHRDAVFTTVEDLIEAGYSIEFHPYLGVKLIDIPDKLLHDEILDDLNTKTIGRNLVIRDEVSSTNDAAWELIEADPALADGSVIVAEHQTDGRGRMGRAWHSARGAGLWLSVVLKTHVPPDKAAFVTCMASLALANMLQQFVYLPAEIKWPNDIIIRGRKACGILVEARSNQPDTFVLGIGMNVNQLREDFPEDLRALATSLRLERPGNAPLNRVRVIRPLMFYLEKVYELLRKKKWDKLAKAWAEFVPMGGKVVTLEHSGQQFKGTVQRIDPQKGITLKLESGEVKDFSAEGVANVREISDNTATA